MQLYCDRFGDGSGFLSRSPFLLLILLPFFLLLLFAFLLFLTLSLVFLPAFVSHGVSPFRLTFSVSRSLWRNKLEVGGIEPPSEYSILQSDYSTNSAQLLVSYCRTTRRGRFKSSHPDVVVASISQPINTRCNTESASGLCAPTSHHPT